MSLFIASNERFIRKTLIFYDPLFGVTIFVVSTSLDSFSLNTKRSVVKVFSKSYGDKNRCWPPDRSLLPEQAALRDTEVPSRYGSLPP